MPTSILSERQNSNLKRNSSVEALRIIAMIFIVTSHCSVHSDFVRGSSSVFFNNIFMDWCVLGNLGVDIFLLISGYFGCERQNPRKSLVPLWTQVWFYSALCSIIYISSGHQMTFKEIIIAFFPTLFKEYWFFTAYLVFLLISPYFNLFLQNISRKQLLHCICILILIWSIVPTFTTRDMYGSEIPQFAMFYLIGAYFKKYPDNNFSNLRVRTAVTASSFFLLFLSSLTLFVLFRKGTSLFYGRNSILIIGCAIGLFTIAIYRKPFHSTLINTIGKCTFGVYLLHDNPLIRKVLWLEWLPKQQFQNSKWLVVYCFISILVVMSVGTIIEYLRRKLIDKKIVSIINRLLSKIFPSTLKTSTSEYSVTK